MPDSRKHRGQHPQDAQLFAPAQLPKLRAAVHDFSWLLSRGYAQKSGIKLVGDRYQLTERQRKAVQRASCSDTSRQNRQQSQIQADDLAQQKVHIDTYNLLISIESALSSGLLFEGQDGCYRDLASIHGTYRKVHETLPALELIGKVLHDLKVSKVDWYIDRPVSNSGRLKVILYELATAQQWNWEVHLVFNPDKELMEQSELVISSDSLILDHATQWFNLARYIVDGFVKEAQVIRLS